MIESIRELARRGRLQLTGDRVVQIAQRIESPLIAREQEVLTLAAQGFSNRRVGESLFISDKTASVHLRHSMAKPGAGTRTEAVSLARQRGLLPG